MDGDGELRGVEGWLQFFLITLAVLTPLYIILGIYVAYDDGVGYAYRLYPGLWWVDMGVPAVTVIACWFAAWRLTTRFNWGSVRITLGILWFLAVLTVVVQPVLTTFVTPLSLQQIYEAGGISLIRPVGYAAIWSSYLARSRRVRNTYAGTAAESAALSEA